MVSEPLTEETKYLNNTLEKGFDTFQLSDIPFTLPNSSNNEGQQLSVQDGAAPPGGYRLYKARFAGLVALVILGIVAGLSGPWFGPIANNATVDFNITLDQVNWLGIVVNLAYLPGALLIPPIILRFGVRKCCALGAMTLILSAWLRVAGTARSLSPSGSYALLIISSIVSSIPQCVTQVLGPTYSEKWFDLQGRTTATMIVGIANPVGNALGQLLSPLLGTTRESILILAIISTAVTPLTFLVGEAPPTPPTYAASKKHQSLTSLGRAMLGQPVEPAAYMTKRERIDFSIIVLIFGVLVGATTGYSVLSAQILQPYGYSDIVSGLSGAAMLLIGLLAAIIAAPLFDRVFTHQLARACKVFVPLTALGWLSLIWAVRPNDVVAIFVISIIIGVCSLPMLPVGMELSCELTRNTDGSAALVWFAGNLFSIIFVLVLSALRAGPNGSPPLNMKRSLIFMGVVVVSLSSLIFFVRGEQRRKAMDEQKLKESLVANLQTQERGSSSTS